MTIQEKVKEIVSEIKEGRIYTIASSWREDYYWYADGEFHSSFENGRDDPKDKGISEERIISEITKALLSPDKYDIGPDFGT